MAVSCEAGGSRAAFGSAASWDLPSACERALLEMLQSENALELMDKAYPEDRSDESRSGAVPRQLAYARHHSVY